MRYKNVIWGIYWLEFKCASCYFTVSCKNKKTQIDIFYLFAVASNCKI